MTLRADDLLSKTVLFELEIRTPAGHVIDTKQFAGVVVGVEGDLLTVRPRRKGAERVLPFDPEWYEPAVRGTYKLAGTGDLVVDPDYVARIEFEVVPDETPSRSGAGEGEGEGDDERGGADSAE